MVALRKKFPPRHEILVVYATIVFLIYGWATIAFFWKVPSWLYFMSLGEIAAILSYTFLSSLVECTLILLIFLAASLVLPSRLLSEKFAVRGSIVVYVLTFWVALLNLISLIQLPTGSDFVSFGILFLLTVSLGLFLAERFSLVQNLLVKLGNRLTIFLYLWLPLSLLGIVVVLFRII